MKILIQGDINTDLLAQALRMLEDRRKYWEKHNDYHRSTSYESALCIIHAALAGDKDELNQFDYYGE